MISGKKEIQNIPVVWEWSWCPKKHSCVIRSSHLCSHLWFWFNGDLFQLCKIMRYTSESWIMLSMENVQGFVNRSRSCSNPLWSVKSIISRHLGCYFLCSTSFLAFGQHNEHNAQDSHWHVSLLWCLRDVIGSGMWHRIDPETQTVLGGSRSASDQRAK